MTLSPDEKNVILEYSLTRGEITSIVKQIFFAIQLKTIGHTKKVLGMFMMSSKNQDMQNFIGFNVNNTENAE